MKPRSLLIRDRSQIGSFGLPTSQTHLGYPKSEQQQEQPQKQQEEVSTSEHDHDRQFTVSSQSHSWLKALLEFVVSLIGGSIGAYVVLFLSGDSYQEWLVLSVLIPLVISELWEFYYLTLTTTIKPADGSPPPSYSKDIRVVRLTKKKIQLRYGQGLFMSAGLAKILSFTDPIDLILQTPTWCAAYTIWTNLFQGSLPILAPPISTPPPTEPATTPSTPTPKQDSTSTNTSTTKVESKSIKSPPTKKRIPPRSLTA